MENIQYYIHTCKCGCGGQIEIKRWHKWRGIPLFIYGHHKGNLGKVRTEKQRQKMSDSQKERFKNDSPWNKGKTGIYSEETLNKIKEARAKQVFSEETNLKKSKSMKGVITWNTGLTKETDDRIKKFSEKFRGEASPNWNNGSSFEPYSPEFNKEKKQQILERDNYECQNPKCKHLSNVLHIHHIDYDKKNSNSENLITLCDSCHTKTNNKNNRQYWTTYYQNILIL